ncbi:LCP family protein [Streptomyces sp. NPDC048718]|uniref:LCP family protein n=1 Tax=Streptomyces sp. NPDC048718 TaxID=3365587 RepID=UPI0037145658
MNDQQNPYDPYYQPQPQIIGYDAYGQPVYQQVAQQYDDPYTAQQPPTAQQQHQQQTHQQTHQQSPQQTPPQSHGQDYGTQDQHSQGYAQDYGQGYSQDYGYDAYGQQQAPAAPGTPTPYDPPQYDSPQYDPYGQQQPGGAYDYQRQTYDTGGQWAVRTEAAPAPAPPQAPAPAPPPEHTPDPQPQRSASVPGQRPSPEDDEPRDYRTEQFSFIEEPDEDSEDVIDWLKFTESRSERREEARRRGRHRVVALVVVLVLAVAGGVGWLWSAGMLPGTSDGGEQGQSTATGPQKRDTIVVHLHDTKRGGTSTALLVDNSTTGRGTTVLIPNTLAVSNDEGSTTTLAKSVEDDGSSGTRDALGNLLGAKIAGTWRLDTPYLENLVELVSNIDLTTDTDVPGAKGAEPLVHKGENQTLNGRAAVAYATYRASGEPEAKQLQRFGQVLYGVLRKISDDPKAATITVETLAQILDPSLPEKDLGASLAKLAEHAKTGAYKTELLPVENDGSLGENTGQSMVKEVLGGKVSAPEQGAATRVAILDASGKDATEAARVVLINGGYAVVGGNKAGARATSEVVYADDAQKAGAAEVAKTLGLPAGSVTKGKATGNAEVTVVLGQDYKIPGSKQ